MAQRGLSSLVMTAFIMTLTACGNPSETAADSKSGSNAHAINTHAADISEVATQNPPKLDPANTALKTIDWATIASGETAANPLGYPYPFAIDSQNVRDYAEYFKVDKPTAQYNLTVGMASNEPLSKVLDQLGTSYVSHELIDAKKIALIIHTTGDVKPAHFDYVIQGDFGKGLVLPIEIKPDGVKSNE